MVLRIVWTRRALEDLREIKDYISKDSKRYAQIQIERIQTAVSKAGRFPEIGRILPEFPKESWREILTGSYRAIYRIDSSQNQVIVVAVVHGRQLLRESMVGPE